MFGDSEDSSDEEVPPQPKRSSSSEGGYEEDDEDDDIKSEVREVKKAPPPSEEEKQAETLVQAVQTAEAKMSTIAAVPQPRRKRFIPKYNVEGVHVITIGEETQVQIELVVGIQINAQYPWKTVQKSKLLESIELGGELSEFFPIRKEIEEYPEDEILMGYIVDESNNTDDFYVCCTVESRDHCKQQSDRFIRRQEKKLEKAIQKKPRPWIGLGSEIEIIEQEPINTRTLMEIEIKAKFPTEYEPQKFNVRDTEAVRDGLIELTAYRQRFNNINRRRIDCACQIRPVYVNQVAQTYLKFPQNKWTQSIADTMGQIGDLEGGGDVDLEGDDDDSSDEEINRRKPPIDEVGLRSYRAAAARMRRPSYQKLMNKFMTSRVAEMESMIELNAVMDMYYNDYPNLVTQKHIDTLGTMAFEEMYLNPPVFMLSKTTYAPRMVAMIERELKVMTSFIEWQANFMQKNLHILLEIKRKEGALLAEKEEEKRRKREELEKMQDEEAEAKRQERMKVLGPEERWQKIIQKLIERTIAVKKRINRTLLIEHEKPLRELETQRLEKERRMLEIMKNQKTIFNDTVAILFPEAIKKPYKSKKSLLSDNKEALKKEYLTEYRYIKENAKVMVSKNPYKADFRWEATLAEGKERRAALNIQQDFAKMHYGRIEGEQNQRNPVKAPVKTITKKKEEEEEVEKEGEGEGVVDEEPTN
ncbi:unnamed protein product [Spodoptera littoralis]|uniref:Uncharacterized protein n=1 Tax=Spodoptera littoralis TaxID=7109 RepID=A0A9P0IJH1_SPOLI|nr:unnamed protein product [Spodoptera littoralis]CAH1646939.1 unnamed protein product [Spodoptera littoralis]